MSDKYGFETTDDGGEADFIEKAIERWKQPFTTDDEVFAFADGIKIARATTIQAKGLITDVAAEIEQIGGAYYADDVAEILRRLADGKKPDFLPAPHSAGLVNIVVNMVEHEVPLATTISYEQVAELAGKPGATHLTMTHHTSKYGGGSLIAGESTRLRAGMHFTAVFTGNA